MKALSKKISSILIFSAIFFPVVLQISCRKVHVYESSSEIAGRSIDTALKDSALIFGTVYDASDKNFTLSGVNIWIEGTDIKTTSDAQGKFNLKLLPGIYTIKCLKPFSNEIFTAVLNNISIVSNEKVEIRFFHGVMIE